MALFKNLFYFPPPPQTVILFQNNGEGKVLNLSWMWQRKTRRWLWEHEHCTSSIILCISLWNSSFPAYPTDYQAETHKQVCTVALQYAVHVEWLYCSPELHYARGCGYVLASLYTGTFTCTISPLPTRTSTYPWKFPSLQAVGKPGLPLLPPSNNTPSAQPLIPKISVSSYNPLNVR